MKVHELPTQRYYCNSPFPCTNTSKHGSLSAGHIMFPSDIHYCKINGVMSWVCNDCVQMSDKPDWSFTLEECRKFLSSGNLNTSYVEYLPDLVYACDSDLVCYQQTLDHNRNYYLDKFMVNLKPSEIFYCKIGTRKCWACTYCAERRDFDVDIFSLKKYTKWLLEG